MSVVQRNNACPEITTQGQGVIYYKLEPGFSGDETKNCGLIGTEIDSNFHFLRGYDIESISIDKNGVLTLERVNGAKLTATTLSESSNEFVIEDLDFEYDKNNGVLKITYKNQELKNLSGFSISESNSISTDNSILGDGKASNPLRINPAERTGTYAPANEYIDLTEDGNELPNAEMGYRVVTKEPSYKFGLLYNYDSLEKINEALEGTGWHVPTKEEFDELLNSVECEGYKNHDSGVTTAFLGKVAGQVLKSRKYWKSYNNPTQDDTNGLDTIGMSIYPTGHGGENTSNPDELKEVSCLWTSTEHAGVNEMAYVKIFHYNDNRVEQTIHSKSNFNAIRLVKDYVPGNYNEVEEILGISYPTLLRNDIGKIWTRTNFCYDYDDLDYINPDFESIGLENEDEVFYVNEWNGETWVKKELKDGDSIVILEKDQKEFREWRLKDGELYDVFGEDFEIESIKDDINDLFEITTELNSNLAESVSAINESISSVETDLNDRIEAVCGLTVTFGEGLIVDNSNVSVLVDEEAEENYLKLSETGLKVEGITSAIESAKENAINTALNALNLFASDLTNDLNKYEAKSGDVIKVQNTNTGTTMSVSIDQTLRKTSEGNLSTALKIEKDNVDGKFYLGYKGTNNEFNKLPGSEGIYFDKNGTITSIGLRQETTGVPYIGINYKDNNGVERVEKISLGVLLNKQYFKDGFDYDDESSNDYPKLYIKVNANDNYLKLNESGLYTTGITEAIDSAYDSACTVIKDYIDAKINELSANTYNAINEINTNFESRVKNIIDNYIVGTEYEIKAERDRDIQKFRIRFADDALFGI